MFSFFGGKKITFFPGISKDCWLHFKLTMLNYWITIWYVMDLQLVLSTGAGVNGFTLDPSLGEFILTHPDIKVLICPSFIVNCYSLCKCSGLTTQLLKKSHYYYKLFFSLEMLVWLLRSYETQHLLVFLFVWTEPDATCKLPKLDGWGFTRHTNLLNLFYS